QIFTLLWVWYIVVFLLNIYSLGLWIYRLIPFRSRYDYIRNRITRTSRDSVPRLRIRFKHVDPKLGGHVQHQLVKSFIREYLEPDGFFFLRLLTANASDFVVQEIIEGLWTYYLSKYGESDAKKAEENYYEFRRQTGGEKSTNSHTRAQLNKDLIDSERKRLHQTTDFDSSTIINLQSAFRPVNEEV
ncbi:unnamed protein product, partial [Didymodactylos carnosus]